MRMMMKVSVPVEAGNRGIHEGVLTKTVLGFVEQTKPEASYFLPEGGKRTMFFVFDLADPTMIPAAAEPFFFNLNASVELTPVMNLDDMKTGVAKAVKRT